jgi:hypothetical protein
MLRDASVEIYLQYDSAPWEVVSSSEEPESGCQRPTLFVLYINLKVRRGINKADVGNETDYVWATILIPSLNFSEYNGLGYGDLHCC